MAEGPEWFAVGLLVAAFLLVAGTVGGVTASSPGGASPPSSHAVSEDPLLVELRDDGETSHYFWPYTSKRKTFDSRTLGINVVVYEDPVIVRRAMAGGTDIEWVPANNTTTDADAETHSIEIDERGIAWSDAKGAVRYTYVETSDGEKRWLRERFQVRDGPYLGSRDHVRAYGVRDGGWTAMQAHTEHWDWFRLRHSVSGVTDAQRRVETDFMEARFVDDVARSYYGNGDNGWVTIVSLDGRLAVLGAALGAVALPSRRELRERFAVTDLREIADALAPLLVPGALYLGVRLGGIALETTTGVPPKLIAATLYPVIAVGVPGFAFVLSRRHARITAFALVAAGLGAAFFVDYLLLGIDVLSLQSIHYRGAVVLSAGLVAAGGADGRDREIAVTGVICWLATLVAPLVGAV